jgi:predicted acyltransferase
MLAPQRFLALDVFRGMTVCFMIIVNTTGNGDTTYSPLMHAHWHGFTPTDLVFPSFLFAVGNAMSFVMNKWQTKSQWYVLGKIFKRTLLIFLLGFLMYWFPFFRPDGSGHWTLAPIGETRILGVLQRIALCYGIAALLIYFLKPRGAFIVSIGLLLGYWGIMYFFGDTGNPYDFTTNAGYYLDKWIMGEAHMYKGEGFPFDPEGWLSTLPAIVNVVAGYLVGRFIQQKSSQPDGVSMGKTYEGLAKLMLAGGLLLFLAYVWNFYFPVNKKLWTSSFVLHTVGLDCLILSGIIYVVDFLQKTKWTYFFQVFGKNPLFIYLLSELGVVLLYIIRIDNMPLYSWAYKNIYAHAGAYFGALLFAVSWMMFCWLIGYVLDRRKIYVRV